MGFINQKVYNYAINYRESVFWDTVCHCDKFSMLHPETLVLLSYFSRESTGHILEIGSFFGGSTVALASAISDTTKKVLTIEKGGAYLAHPYYPSSDIIRDLRLNINKFHLNKNVTIFQGSSDDPKVIQEVKRKLDGGNVGLLFIDADGDVGRDIKTFYENLQKDCIIVLDDYYSEGAKEKESIVNSWVENAKKSGFVEEICVVKWGTWFGKINKTAGLS